jgi:hypothetical protein
MSMRINLSSYSLPNDESASARELGHAGKRRSPFLAGPIDLGWLQRASRLPGKALHCALCLCHLARLHRTLSIAFSPSLRRSFGIGRKGAAQGLNALAKEGLVHIEGRSKGAAPVVTLVGGLEL